MIRVIVQYPDYLNENDILQDGTKVINTYNDKELLQVLKNIYESKQVNHVHLEFGFYNKLRNFVYKGEVIIPFEEGVTPFVKL